MGVGCWVLGVVCCVLCVVCCVEGRRGGSRGSQKKESEAIWIGPHIVLSSGQHASRLEIQPMGNWYKSGELTYKRIVSRCDRA